MMVDNNQNQNQTSNRNEANTTATTNKNVSFSFPSFASSSTSSSTSSSSSSSWWQFDSPQALHAARAKANWKAREHLFALASGSSSSSSSSIGREEKIKGHDNTSTSTHTRTDTDTAVMDNESMGPWQSPPENITDKKNKSKAYPYLNVEEEALLVSFYVSKLPLLIGPHAVVNNALQRVPSKVTATAALFTRRFFAHHSVMQYDPKVFMVASAFLASKVEDATVNSADLANATITLGAPVTQPALLAAELILLSQGLHFDVTAARNHIPYSKCVLALTEDVRMHLKKSQFHHPHEQQLELELARLKPMYDRAKQILDHVMVSDMPLLSSTTFAPSAQVALAALMIAIQDNDEDDENVNKIIEENEDDPRKRITTSTIDLKEYVRQRFALEEEDGVVQHVLDQVDTLAQMLRQLPLGQHGCLSQPNNSNHNHKDDHHSTNHPQWAQLKAVHKKLKKVSVWIHRSNTTNTTAFTMSEQEEQNKKKSNPPSNNSKRPLPTNSNSSSSETPSIPPDHDDPKEDLHDSLSPAKKKKKVQRRMDSDSIIPTE